MTLKVQKDIDLGKDFSIQRGLSGYERVHDFDIAKFIEMTNLENGYLFDIGCGQGNFLRDIRRIFPEMHAYGIDKIKYRGQPRGVIVGDARDISFEDNKFDLIFSTVLSQWINNNDRNLFYSEAKRVLSPRGYGFIYPFNIPLNEASRIFGNNYSIRTLEKGPSCLKVPQLIFWGEKSKPICFD